MLPEWVQKYKKAGTTIKTIGGSYYLYKATSKRVAGKKNPVSIQEYLGRITDLGVRYREQIVNNSSMTR